MEVQINKWGNSLGIRIPKAFADMLGVDANSTLDMRIENNALVFKPLPEDDNPLAVLAKGSGVSLADLCADMTPYEETEAIDDHSAGLEIIDDDFSQ